MARVFRLPCLLAAVLAASMFGHVPSAIAGDPVLDEIGTGFSSPVVATAPTGDGRVFVAEQPGIVRVLTSGSSSAATFLDIRGLVRSGGEQGLLDLAFHPDYASNGRFLVHHTDLAGNTVVAEYQVSSNPDVADPATRRVILQVGQPARNHNGGTITFGPDGYLYVALGDGGGGNDTYGNGQNTSTPLGAILRIDADTGAAAPGNPHGLVWAYGVRNPWRASFDPATGHFWVGDVGQGTREEVTVIRSAGANLGWPILEGSICRPPTTTCTAPPDYVAPIHDYERIPGPRSITGGVVYRGTNVPDLAGAYFYADFYEGVVRSFRDASGVAVDHRSWASEFGQIPFLVSFGTDGAGEMLVVSLGGSVYSLVEGATRLAGSNRYETAAAVSREVFSSPNVAYLVTGANWPDALVAGSAGDGPVLLTERDTIPNPTRTELTRLGPLDEIVIVGGPNVVSDAVATRLASYAGTVTRSFGPDRFATAAAFSRRMHAGTASVVYVATGENYPDALVTAAAAGHQDAPLLLTRAGTLPGATRAELARLAPDTIIVVGGPAAVSDSVYDSLATLARSLRRIAGPDRYTTAAAVSRNTFGMGGAPYVATGVQAPDALVAAAAAVNEGVPVLLVQPGAVPAPTAKELARLSPSDIRLVGGVGAVDRQTQADLGAFFD